jgi:Haem-NO-binding
MEFALMKGVIFTEFLALVEERFGLKMVDEILQSAELDSGGAYTSLGTYHHQELLTLVGLLSERSGIPSGDLVKIFGHHLIAHFTQRYTEFFDAEPNTLQFLTRLEGHIHREVRKLYSDTELPRFEWEFESDNVLKLTYMSRRPFAALARGMIEATALHYGDELGISETDLSTETMNKVQFTLEKLN